MWSCHLVLGVPLLIAGLFFLLPWPVAFPIALLLGIGTAAITYQAARALRRPVITGKAALIGGVGDAVSDLTSEGLAKVGSELWVAETPGPISKGARIRSWRSEGPKSGSGHGIRGANVAVSLTERVRKGKRA